ncbi:MAG: MBL fold metallo-hydrolase, partial [Bacteroidota bacterium]
MMLQTRPSQLLLLLAVLLTGCTPIVNRFMARTFERIAATSDPAPIKIANPVLNDVGISVVWVGHATTLIQIHDKVFLTDPVFTKTVGMISTRYVEPGIDLSTLAKVDYTLISHTHMDHFSYGSLDMLPKNGKLLLPYGAAMYAPEFHFPETREMKRWEALEENDVRITAVPVRHFGGRYGFDFPWVRDRGYTGWVIVY